MINRGLQIDKAVVIGDGVTKKPRPISRKPKPIIKGRR